MGDAIRMKFLKEDFRSADIFYCLNGTINLRKQDSYEKDKFYFLEEEKEKCFKIPCENDGFGYNLVYDCFKCEKEGEEE